MFTYVCMHACMYVYARMFVVHIEVRKQSFAMISSYEIRYPKDLHSSPCKVGAECAISAVHCFSFMNQRGRLVSECKYACIILQDCRNKG